MKPTTRKILRAERALREAAQDYANALGWYKTGKQPLEYVNTYAEKLAEAACKFAAAPRDMVAAQPVPTKNGVVK